jgi:hypothetical protein
VSNIWTTRTTYFSRGWNKSYSDLIHDNVDNHVGGGGGDDDYDFNKQHTHAWINTVVKTYTILMKFNSNFVSKHFNTSSMWRCNLHYLSNSERWDQPWRAQDRSQHAN